MNAMRAKAAAILVGVAVSLTFWEGGFCQKGDVGAFNQPIEVVDFPTAGLIPRGGFRIKTDVYAQGGVLVFLDVGFTRYFNFGISYGGSNIIGSGDPEMNPQPAVSVRARILEEEILIPAVAIGFSSQGIGMYIDDRSRCQEERYLVKSRGIYAVASKNWDILGPLSIHAGLNVSLEKDLDDDPTVFLGLIKSVGEIFDLGIEYDFGFNDNEGQCQVVEKRGYLNLNVVWHMAERISLAITARDIASKKKSTSGDLGIEDMRKWNRGIAITYYGFL